MRRVVCINEYDQRNVIGSGGVLMYSRLVASAAMAAGSVAMAGATAVAGTDSVSFEPF